MNKSIFFFFNMNGAEIEIYNFEKICRLCLHEKQNFTEIFESSLGDNCMSLQQKIMACTSINLHTNDGLPTKICFKCLSNVNAAFDFKIQCQNADKKLHDIKNFILNKTDTEENVFNSNCNGFIIDQEEGKFLHKITPENLNQIFFIEKQTILNSTQNFTNINDESDKEKSQIATFTESNMYDASEIFFSIKSENSDFQQNQEKCNEKISNKNSTVAKAIPKVVNDFCEKEKRIKVNKHKAKNEENFGLDRRKTPCPYCNKMLMRMDEHIRLLHRNRVYICTKQGCGAEFATLKNLQSHQLRCYDVKKAYKCYECAKEFHRNSNFKAHIRRHSNKKDFQCQLCDKAFIDSTGLRRHFLKHHEPEQQIFVSGCCGKRFKSKEGLRKHISKSICGMQIIQLIDSGY